MCPLQNPHPPLTTHKQHATSASPLSQPLHQSRQICNMPRPVCSSTLTPIPSLSNHFATPMRIHVIQSTRNSDHWLFYFNTFATFHHAHILFPHPYTPLITNFNLQHTVTVFCCDPIPNTARYVHIFSPTSKRYSAPPPQPKYISNQ